MIIPALSLKQPWASLVAQGSKTIETRVWGTRYRGPLAICSSLQPRDQGPAGYALCVMMLKSCRTMTAADEAAARCQLYDRAVAWCFGRRWPLYQFRVRGERGLFTVIVPETNFPDPQDRHEVQQALEWAQRNGYLKFVRGSVGSDRSVRSGGLSEIINHRGTEDTER